MQTSHTPGPWAVNAPDTTSVVWDLGGADVTIAQEIRTPANAALIAAAPDLLAALQALAAVCENEGFPYLGNVLPKARAAIARATGA